MATFGGGFINTAQIADNAVTPAKISSGIILQQLTHVATTDLSTTSGTYVAMTASEVAITTTGADVLIEVIVSGTGGATWRPAFALFKDAAEVLASDHFVNAGSGQAAFVYLDSPTAAAHTYALYWKSSAGGSSVTSNASSGEFERVITVTEVK